MQVGGLVVIQGQQVAKGMPIGQEHEHVLWRVGGQKSFLTLHPHPGKGQCSAPPPGSTF